MFTVFLNFEMFHCVCVTKQINFFFSFSFFGIQKVKFFLNIFLLSKKESKKYKEKTKKQLKTERKFSVKIFFLPMHKARRIAHLKLGTVRNLEMIIFFVVFFFKYN